MNLANCDELMQREVQKRLRKGYGEIVTIKWKELPEDPDTGEFGEVIDHEDQFYVGALDMGQTGTIVAVIGAVVLNGLDLKSETGRVDNLAFINRLDPHNLAVFLGTLLHESADWVQENYKIAWAIDVARRFLQHNDFFGPDEVMQKVLTRLAKVGVSEAEMRQVALGQSVAQIG